MLIVRSVFDELSIETLSEERLRLFKNRITQTVWR